MKRGRLIIFVIVFSFFLFINFISASNVKLLENSTWSSSLTPVRFSATALGDVNNDGKLDLAEIGCLSAGANACTGGVVAKIYINNGTSLVENSSWEGNLTAVGRGSLTFGDVNNDGKLDLLLTGCTLAGDDAICTGSIVSKIYINNGTSLTESSQWQNNITKVYDSSAFFGDINNDGKIDLALIGTTNSGGSSKIYINNGTSLVENSSWKNNLQRLSRGQSILADLNNDGRMDLFLTGDNESSFFVQIYINNGTSLVENSSWEQNLAPPQIWSSAVSGDFDNDGRMDFVWAGQGDYIYVYKNNGTTLLINQSRSQIFNGLIGIFRASLALGDYNNDGLLDLAAMGHESGYTRIFENNYSYYFVQDATAHANISDNLFQGSFVWGDFNKDGKLDLALSGVDPVTTLTSKIDINNGTTANNVPMPPNSSFSSNYSNNTNQLMLSWGNGSDVETNTSGLYYNIMVGNVTDNNTIVTGVYGGTSGGGFGVGGGAGGYYGNMQEGKNITLNVNLSDGTYYWYVQTIDTALSTSNWSERQLILVNSSAQVQEVPYTPPVVNGGSGGGGGTYIPPLKKFDVDFSLTSAGTLEEKEGDVKTISFNGQTTHKITITELTSNSAKLLIESEPIVLVLNVGETKKIDVNKDNLDDLEIKLISISSGTAIFTVTKLSGADVVAREEAGKPALFDVKITIPDRYKNVLPGEDVTANIEVFNVNNIGQVDVVVNYYLIDKENKTKLATGTDTLAVEAVTSFVRTLTVPKGTEAGTYDFGVDVSYKNITTSGRTEFNVNSTRIGNEIIIGGVIIVIFMFAVIAYLIIIRKRELKLERQIRKLRRKKKIR